MTDLATLYEALQNAETGGESNKWIRTKYNPPDRKNKDGTITPIGSSAFGPAQVTLKKVNDYVGRGIISGKLAEWANNKMVPMQEKFNYYGDEPNKAGYEKRYDYGGAGEKFDEVDRANYNAMVMKMIEHDYQLAQGDNMQMLRIWKEGYEGSKDPNKKLNSGYIKRYKEKLND